MSHSKIAQQGLDKIERVHRRFWWSIGIGVGVFLFLLSISATRLLFCEQLDEWTANTYNYSQPNNYWSNASGYIIARHKENPSIINYNPNTLYTEYFQKLFCGGEMKFADLIIGLLTYCLIIVAWQQTRISDETTKRTERAYIVGRGPYGLPKPKTLRDKFSQEIEVWPEADHFREPRRMTIQNYGKTPGFIISVDWGLCWPDDFPKDSNGKDVSVSKAIRENLIPFEPAKDPSDTYPPTEGGWKTFRQIEFNRTENIGKIFFGVIRYMDVFKEVHYSAFKMRLDNKFSPSIGDTHAVDWD